MNISYKRWKELFVLCVGLTLGTVLCMKWIEIDFRINGDRFTMIGLELFYSKQKIIAILSNLSEHVATLLNYHLHFDFLSMAGIFPGIAALCMMAKEKISSAGFRKLLFILAYLQLAAWAGDIAENLYLLTWLERRVIGSEFGAYRFIVLAKWVIALAAFICSSAVLLIRPGKKQVKQ